MNSSIRPNHKIRWSLRASTIDGSSYGVMMGLGEANIVVFAVALGMNAAVAGLVGSVPLLFGSVAQLMTPWAVHRLRSHRRWIVLCAVLQVLAFVPMVIGAAIGAMPTMLVFLFASLYWFSAFASGAAWNTFIAGNVLPRIRTRYFGQRTRLTSLALVFATFGAGLALEFGTRSGLRMETLAALFALAAMARGVSATLLHLQIERVPMPDGQRSVSTRELLRRFRHGHDGRLLVYLLFTTMALSVSSPYIGPYLLKSMKLEDDYLWFGILGAAILASKAIATPWMSAIAHRHGASRLLWIGGISVIGIPVLWLVGMGHSVWWILIVQALSGVALAAYEMAVFLHLLESIPDRERTSVMSKYVLASYAALTLGSLVGAGILKLLGEGATGFAIVFGASLVLRALGLVLLARIGPKDAQVPGLSG